jgi:hypothetical protein
LGVAVVAHHFQHQQQQQVLRIARQLTCGSAASLAALAPPLCGEAASLLPLQLGITARFLSSAAPQHKQPADANKQSEEVRGCAAGLFRLGEQGRGAAAACRTRRAAPTTLASTCAGL